MRIAFISTILGYPWGGADTLWTHAAEAAGRRHDSLFIAVSPLVAEHPRIARLPTAVPPFIQRQPSPPRTFADRLGRKLGLADTPDNGLITALRSFRPERVIFSLGGTYDLTLYPRLVRWLMSQRIPYRLIANWQQEEPHLNAADLKFIRATFNSADRIHFVSTRNLTVTRRHLGLPLANADVIQNPLRWMPSDVSPWPDAAGCNLATVSRLDEGKGIQVLLAALNTASAHLPGNWRLTIYGQGPYEAQLRDLTQRLRLNENVRFGGYVKELRTIWADHHLMVSPAIEDGVPMTIPEAMLCQRPVLATCVGGAEDWLRDGQTGFLCPRPTPDALAQTLVTACAARATWPAIGLAAAEAAAARYLPDDYNRLIAP